MNNGANKVDTTSYIIGFIILAIIIFVIWKMISGVFGTSSVSTNDGGKPDDVELMTYAQTVVKDYFSDSKFSSNPSNYKFIETGLQYKIEGYVTTNSKEEKFYIVIRFSDDKYKEYDVVSLQVGNKRIY